MLFLLRAGPAATQAPQSNTFEFGSHLIPHPDKADRGGEDALHASSSLLAVADGVGGWATQNVNPALFARHLCREAGLLAERQPEQYLEDPRSLMRDAWQTNQHPGSSTFVLVTLAPRLPKVTAANLGDSGYMVFGRNPSADGVQYALKFVSEAQVHGFNFPYQLARKSSKVQGSTPSDANVQAHEVAHEDIVVVVSDGVSDNLSPEQVEAQINRFLLAFPFDAQRLAQLLAEEAFKLSLDETYESPFAKEARAQGLSFVGGKSDDISVALGRVRLAGAEAETEL